MLNLDISLNHKMGNNHPTEKKHLVIVGASFGGLILLDKIKDDFNITLIEMKDHFEWICSMPKSIMDTEYFLRDAVVDLKQCIELDHVFGDNVQFLQSMLTEIVDEKSIKVKRTDHIQEGQTIDDVAEEVVNYDYLVIWTGTHFKANEADAKDVAHLFTVDQRLQFLEKYSDEIDKANSVLVVGGGPTGTECLGEIQRKYGNSKKYGLINNQPELLAGFPDRACRKAANHFTNRNVRVHIGQRFNPNSELAKEYDFVMMWVGLNYHTPFMDKNYANCKDRRGRIYVNEYFQITTQNPEINSSDEVLDHPIVHANILCYGDAWATRMREPKNVPAIRTTSYIVAHNLKALAYGGELREMPYMVDNLAGVYFANYSGTIVFNDFAMSNCLTLTAKNFIEGTFIRKYKNRCCGKAR